MTRITFLILTIILTSCFVRSRQNSREYLKMESCRNTWTYNSLPSETEITVLLFQKKFRFDLNTFPNFVIGVTENADTIAVIDKDFDGELKKSIIISVSQANWTKDEKTLIKPAFTVYKKTADNSLHCSVKNVYYGSISKKRF